MILQAFVDLARHYDPRLILVAVLICLLASRSGATGAALSIDLSRPSGESGWATRFGARVCERVRVYLLGRPMARENLGVPPAPDSVAPPPPKQAA